MKYTILIIAITLLVSCFGKKESNTGTPKEGSEKIVAVWINPDSTKQIDMMVRQILKTIKYDSTEKKDIITIDTLWGKPINAPVFDSLNKPVFENGIQKTQRAYQLIRKDSVNWHIEGISVDSLLKK